MSSTSPISYHQHQRDGGIRSAASRQPILEYQQYSQRSRVTRDVDSKCQSLWRRQGTSHCSHAPAIACVTNEAGNLPVVPSRASLSASGRQRHRQSQWRLAAFLRNSQQHGEASIVPDGKFAESIAEPSGRSSGGRGRQRGVLARWKLDAASSRGMSGARNNAAQSPSGQNGSRDGFRQLTRLRTTGSREHQVRNREALHYYPVVFGSSILRPTILGRTR